MKICLVVASLSLGLLLQAQVQAREPDITVEVVVPTIEVKPVGDLAILNSLEWLPEYLDDTTRAHTSEALILSTPAGTALHVQAGPLPASMLRVEYSEPPKKYDYRYARKVERVYNRHRRYYRRRNRQEIHELRRDNLKKARKFDREQRKRPREPLPNSRLLLNSDPRRRINVVERSGDLH